MENNVVLVTAFPPAVDENAVLIGYQTETLENSALGVKGAKITIRELAALILSQVSITNTVNLSDDVIATRHLQAGCVTHAKIATDAVETSNLKNNCVTWAKLGETLRKNFAPIGSMVIWPGSTVPQGWLLCNGQQVSSTQYPTLAAVFGKTGNFNLPDMDGGYLLATKSETNDNFVKQTKTGHQSNPTDMKVQITADHLPQHQHVFEDWYFIEAYGFNEWKDAYCDKFSDMKKDGNTTNISGRAPYSGHQPSKSSDGSVYDGKGYIRHIQASGAKNGYGYAGSNGGLDFDNEYVLTYNHKTYGAGKSTIPAIGITPPYIKVRFIIKAYDITT